ncbi:MAG TPA: tetratricopeptide repeat protein [Aggregatilineales bacterium]|nr:tetratricopeptide repeat protein [Aggregatilineales bacterium]
MESNRTIVPFNPPIYDARQLPVQPPAQMVGRDRELASIQVTLKVGSSVFLAGEAGIGKTALAAIMATAYAGGGPSGVLWFNLVEEDFPMLMARVGRAFGVDTYAAPGQDSSQAAAQVRALLQQDKPLVVLDGIVDPEAARDFVRQCATGIPVIVTGEEAMAGPWTPISLEPLSAEDSVSLYKLCSNLRDPLYDPDITGLCRFLGGNPLAMQLAGRAALVDDLLPAELLTRLPSSSGRDSHLIMTSLQFQLVPAPVQAVWLVMAALSTGGASLELLSAISGIPTPELLSLLQNLEARGLVTESKWADQGVFALHEIAQSYAHHWLTQSQRMNSLQNRMLKAVQGYMDREIDNPTRLSVEMNNILGAAAFATSTGQVGALRQLIRSLGETAGDFVTTHGFQPELDSMRKLATLFDEGEDAVASPGVVTPPAPQEIETPIQAPEDFAAEGTSTRSFGANESGPFSLDETQPTEEEVTVMRQPVEADSSSHEVSVIEEPPRSPEDTDIPTEGSLATLQERLAEAEKSGDFRRQGKYLSAIAQYYAERDDPSAALDHYKQALESYESIEDNDGILACLDALGALAAQNQDAEGAVVYATRGLNLARQQQNATHIGRFLTRLGDVRLSLHDTPAALEAYSQAAEALRATEDWLSIGLVMAKLGNAYLESQQYREALMMLEQALVIFVREQRQDYVGRVYGSMGMSYSGLQDSLKAREFFEKALALAHQNDDSRGEAAQFSALAHLSKQQNDMPGAVERYRHALHIAYELDDPDLTAEFAFELGALLIDHPSTLLMGLKLLEESDQAAPNSEARRLLGRGNKRLERARAAGLPIAPADLSSQEYAAQVVAQDTH